MQLPTPFIKGLKGVQISISGNDSLQILLPAFLRAKRRYCEVRVFKEPLTDSFLVEVLHQELFTRPIPGRNAWQIAYKRPLLDLPSTFSLTALDRPVKSINGNSVDLAFFYHRIQCGEPCTYKTIHVRVTPEGFQFRVFRTAQEAAISSHRATNLESAEEIRRLIESMERSPNHGGRIATSATHHQFINKKGELRLLSHPPFSPRTSCRCVVKETGAIARLKDYMTSLPEWTEALQIESQPRQRALTTKYQPDKYLWDNLPTPAHMLDGMFIGEIETIELNQNGDSKMNTIDNTTNATQPLSVAGQKIVRAVFEDGRGHKDYAYYTNDNSLVKGDFAIVVSPFGNLYDDKSQGYITVVKVISIEETVEAITKASKWIVQKVDLDSYREHMAQIARVKLLDAKIEVARKEAMHRLELKQLMDLSPELATLVKERLELDGGTSGSGTFEDAIDNRPANTEATINTNAMGAELAAVTHLA
jgi:hypothetical protein